ncbi:hypothetical protein BLX87_16365 [Bacillus sp. VT-16-64]|nr:hypothetical protein BLX87_16365 [Bacillus sp. VT-16-64]
MDLLAVQGNCSLAPTLLNAQFAAGIGCVCVVLVMVRAPAFLPDPLDRVFGKLGDWSYGLYLICECSWNKAPV